MLVIHLIRLDAQLILVMFDIYSLAKLHLFALFGTQILCWYHASYV